MGIKKSVSRACTSAKYLPKLIQGEKHQSVLILKISSRKTKKNRQSALKKKISRKNFVPHGISSRFGVSLFKKPQYSLKNTQDWTLYISTDQDIFSFGNHFINSHNLFSDIACNILRRKLMLRPHASFFSWSPAKKGKKGRFITD